MGQVCSAWKCHEADGDTQTLSQQLPLWSTDKQLHSAAAWMVQVLGRDLALVPTLVSSKTLCRMTGEKETRAHALLQFRLLKHHGFLICAWLRMKNTGLAIPQNTTSGTDSSLVYLAADPQWPWSRDGKRQKLGLLIPEEISLSTNARNIKERTINSQNIFATMK